MNSQYTYRQSEERRTQRCDCEDYEYHILHDDEHEEILDEYIKLKRQAFYDDWFRYLGDECE